MDAAAVPDPILVRSWRTPTFEAELRALDGALGDADEILARLPERLWLRIFEGGVALQRTQPGDPLLLIPASRITHLAVETRQPRHSQRTLNALDQWALAFTWGMGRTVWPRVVVTVRRDDGTTGELRLPATDTLGVSAWGAVFRPRHWPTLKRAGW